MFFLLIDLLSSPPGSGTGVVSGNGQPIFDTYVRYLLFGDDRQAGGGNRLADPPAFFIGQLDVDLIRQPGELCFHYCSGAIQQKLAALA